MLIKEGFQYSVFKVSEAIVLSSAVCRHLTPETWHLKPFNGPAHQGGQLTSGTPNALIGLTNQGGRVNIPSRRPGAC